jgi:AraC family transcriptional regulator
MGGTMRAAVERAVMTMWDRYDEPLTLDELADIAILSKFHFCRVFCTVTGTSPGRFLSAVRLYRAKNLLLETLLSVANVSHLVGYNSTGTFASRFTRSVGMSPSRYRYMSQIGISPPAPPELTDSMDSAGVVHGTLHLPRTSTPVRTYVAAFDSRIPEGVPVSCYIVRAGGEYRLDKVPRGNWYVHAIAVAIEDVDPLPWHRRPLFVDTGLSVAMSSGETVQLNLAPHPVCPIDLPVLLALPELDNHEPPAGQGLRVVQRNRQSVATQM